MATNSPRDAALSTCVQDAAGDRARAARVRIVWPSLGTTLANMAERTDAGLRWWDDAHGQPMGPGEQLPKPKPWP